MKRQKSRATSSKRRSGSLINTLWLKPAVINGLHQYGSMTCPRFWVVSNPIRESILFAEAKQLFSLNNARGKTPQLHISASIWGTFETHIIFHHFRRGFWANSHRNGISSCDGHKEGLGLVSAYWSAVCKGMFLWYWYRHF
jgi:hypothetical protein